MCHCIFGWSWPSSTSLQAKFYLSLPVLAIHSDLFFAISMHEPHHLGNSLMQQVCCPTYVGENPHIIQDRARRTQRCRGKLAIWHAVCQDFFLRQKCKCAAAMNLLALLFQCFLLPVRVRWRSNYHLAKLSQSVLHKWRNAPHSRTEGKQRFCCPHHFVWSMWKVVTVVLHLQSQVTSSLHVRKWPI